MKGSGELGEVLPSNNESSGINKDKVLTITF